MSPKTAAVRSLIPADSSYAINSLSGPLRIKTSFQITHLSQNNRLFACFAVILTALIVLKASEIKLQLFFL